MDALLKDFLCNGQWEFLSKGYFKVHDQIIDNSIYGGLKSYNASRVTNSEKILLQLTW
jgi:regulator of sigma D